MSEAANERILVIKTGALGDFIQALGAMQAIRRHHPHAHITLLTTGPYEILARACGYFDDIWLDPRPRGPRVAAWLGWRRKLRRSHFTRVYDLQNSERTALYSWLLAPGRPEWVGHAPFASHRNASSARTEVHALDGHARTLAKAGIADVRPDDLSWMKSDVERFRLASPYALFAPGCAPGHPEKRWPAARFGAAAAALAARGITPVVLGTKDEADLARAIQAVCPQAVDLTGQTALMDIAPLARGAMLAVGNDTGPVHFIAATGCPTLALFSRRSDPVRAKPKGANVTLLRRDDLDALTADEVIAALPPLRG